MTVSRAVRDVGPSYLYRNERMSVDDTVLYTGVVRLVLDDCSTVVDVGCGRGQYADRADLAPMFDFRGPGRAVVGMDIDPGAAVNPFIDEFRLLETGQAWPVETDSVDLVVSDWTLEHVADPEHFVAELTRVLHVGGAFIARTVGARSALAATARAVPNRLHAKILHRWQPERRAVDVFPTQYRMNTRRQLDELLGARYTYSFAGRASFANYVRAKYPRTSRFVEATERRLPDGLQSAFVVCAQLLEK